MTKIYKGYTIQVKGGGKHRLFSVQGKKITVTSKDFATIIAWCDKWGEKNV